jgi:hypothetical protein
VVGWLKVRRKKTDGESLEQGCGTSMQQRTPLSIRCRRYVLYNVTPAKAGVQGGWNYLRANGDVASCLLPPILDSGFRRNDDKDETWRLAREGGSRERAENGRNGRDERQECRRDA